MNNLKIEVWDQLHRINNIMMPEPHKGHEKPLIGRGQVKILKEIMKESNLSQDDLAKKARVDKTTVAKSVKKMEAQGLIKREKSADDQRKYKLFATKEATHMIERMDQHLEKAASHMFEGISKSEIETLVKVLDKLEENLNNQRVERDKQRDMGYNLIRKLKELGFMEKTKLQADLGLAKKDFEDLLLRLVERRVIKEDAGLLYLNETHEEAHLRHKKEMNDRRNPKHEDIFRLLFEHDGLTVEELAEKVHMPVHEVKEILRPALDHGKVVENDALLTMNEFPHRRPKPF